MGWNHQLVLNVDSYFFLLEDEMNFPAIANYEVYLIGEDTIIMMPSRKSWESTLRP